MFDKIILHDELGGLIRLCCHENNMSVDFDTCFIKHGLLDHEKIIILKVDDFYSTKNMVTPPPSIDCLVITKCEDGSYSFYLIELRDVTGTKLIKPKEMIPKFNTVINDFFKLRFPDIFLHDDLNIKEIKMWVVSDALGTKDLSEEQYRRKIKGTVIEQYLSIKPFYIKNLLVPLEVVSPILSSPKPTIRGC